VLGMRAYLISLGVGVLVGGLYGLLHVSSPAPPFIALVGLLGMLIGEQTPSRIVALMHREAVVVVRSLNTPDDGGASSRAPGSEQ
jgi:XapX domain-containing protein